MVSDEKLPPVEDLIRALDSIVAAKAKAAAVDAKRKPRKPYRRAFSLPVTMPPEGFYAVHDVDGVRLVSGIYIRVQGEVL